MAKKWKNLKWRRERAGGSTSPQNKKGLYEKAKLELKIKKVQAKMDFLKELEKIFG